MAKNLRLNISANIDWRNHIEKGINKPKSVVGWISRTVISREKEVMMNIYKSLVHQHLEYAVHVRNPDITRKNWYLIMEIEGVHCLTIQ